MPWGEGVIGALAEVLKKAREEARREPKHIAYHLRTGDRSVIRFEQGIAGPPLGDLDELVWAYAAESGVGWAELWDRAVKRAAEEPSPVQRDLQARRRRDAGEPEQAFALAMTSGYSVDLVERLTFDLFDQRPDELWPAEADASSPAREELEGLLRTAGANGIDEEDLSNRLAELEQGLQRATWEAQSPSIARDRWKRLRSAFRQSLGGGEEADEPVEEGPASEKPA
jgi:hypothetical protein